MIGEIVHFYHVGQENPVPAIVCAENEPPEGSKDPPTINVCCFGTSGETYAKTNVKFVEKPAGDEDFDCCVPMEHAKAKPKAKPSEKHHHS